MGRWQSSDGAGKPCPWEATRRRIGCPYRPREGRRASLYREAFKGDRGVTQGDPLSPTIFNVVVDAVVRHWVTMVLAEAEKRGERGNKDRHQVALFYADDGMVASSDPRWL